MTRRRKYKRYSPEFKREALRRASEDGIVDKEVCDELGISARQLRRWRDQFRLHGDSAFIGQGHGATMKNSHISSASWPRSSRSVIF